MPAASLPSTIVCSARVLVPCCGGRRTFFQILLNIPSLNMPKWKSYYDSDRKYKKEWEKKYSWLQKAQGNSDDAFCTLCHCTVKSKLYHFAQHEQSSKHKSKVPGVNQNTLRSFVNVTKNNTESEENIKQAEIKLAVAVTCHCSVMAVDHLTDVILLIICLLLLLNWFI